MSFKRFKAEEDWIAFANNGNYQNFAYKSWWLHCDISKVKGDDCISFQTELYSFGDVESKSGGSSCQ